jgi:tetratricopeptide (TPR) repeat protein
VEEEASHHGQVGGSQKEFQQGRVSLSVCWRKFLQHFDKSLALDPEFASAELAREQLSHREEILRAPARQRAGDKHRTVKAADPGQQAAANSLTEIQKQYLDQLVAAINDRRFIQVGNYYFGQQQYEQAITHYKQATQLAPELFLPITSWLCLSSAGQLWKRSRLSRNMST